MELEKVAIAWADDGRLPLIGMVVTTTLADELAERLTAAARPDGDDLVYLRARGRELLPLAVKVPEDDAERILADVRKRRDF